MLNKLVPVLGNVCEANLGIDQDTANMMVKEVDIIVNSAANTTFDERLLQINIWSLCIYVHVFFLMPEASIYLMKSAGMI